MAEELVAQAMFDYGDLLEDDRGYVKVRAEHIRETAKRTALGVISIGQWLTEVKAKLGHGRWESWLATEFGWGLTTAWRLMQVYELVKSSKLEDLIIDVSALYLISAPATPEPVVREVIRRAEAGEPMTHAKAAAVLNEHRKLATIPTPKVARQIALATGKATLATSGVYVPPLTEEQEKVEAKEKNFVRGIYLALETVAKAGITPVQMATLGHKQDCRHLAEYAEQAGSWLLDVTREAREYEAIGSGAAV